ncbi:hypothetical protein TNCV_3431851 [Trichonephila clavipes]|nr:hypothetical protein TNCV_3431851 [Trichonephila clavipes]
MVWLLLRWIDGVTTAAREGCGYLHVLGHQRRKVRSGYLPFRMKMRLLSRSCQNDRLRVMLVLVHIAITSPHCVYRLRCTIGVHFLSTVVFDYIVDGQEQQVEVVVNFSPAHPRPMEIPCAILTA